MQKQFEVAQLQNVFEKLGEFFHMKVFFGWIFIFLSWCLDGSYEILVTICILIIIDNITGMWMPIKNKILQWQGKYDGPADQVFSSRGLYRGPFKCVVYFMFILVSRLVDKHIPFPFASPMIDSFLVATEGYSIFENFAKMGFATPTLLIDKLKSLTTKKSE